jgi:AbrB family looped-hinge helix DNA binding protein
MHEKSNTISLPMNYRLTRETDVKEIVSTITSKGQVTIPAAVRKHLGVSQGDKLSFVIADDGTIALKAPNYPDVASLAGAAGTLAEQLSWEQTREIAREDRFDATQNV